MFFGRLKIGLLSVFVLSVIIGFITFVSAQQSKDIFELSVQPSDDVDKDFLIFTKNYMERVYADTVPEIFDCTDVVSTFVSLGEYEPVTFAIYAKQNLENVKISMTDLIDKNGNIISAENIDLRIVSSIEKRTEYKGDSENTEILPEILDYYKPVNISANTSRQYWMKIYVPEDTVPGNYKADIIVNHIGGKEQKLTLNLEVLPITLSQDIDKNNGIFYLGVLSGIDFLDGVDKSEVSKEKLLNIFNQNIKDLAKHGVSRIIYAPTNKDLGIIFDKNLNPDFGLLMESLRILQNYKFTAPIPFMGIKNTWNYLDENIEESEIRDAKFIEVVKSLQFELSRNQLQQLLYFPYDDPFDNEYKNSKEFRHIVGLIQQVDGKVFNTNVLNEDENEILFGRKEYDDLETENRWRYHKNPDSYSLEEYRLINGFYLWNSDFDVIASWAYQDFVKNPFDDTDGDSSDIAYSYPDSENSYFATLPTLKWEVYREGVDDLKYLYTLINIVEGNQFSISLEEGDLEEAKELINELKQKLNSLGPDLEGIKEGFMLEGYRNYRYRLANAIIDLTGKTIETEVNKNLVAVAKAYPAKGVAPVTVQFTAKESYNPDDADEDLNYMWNFGNGDFSNLCVTTRTFDKPGSYKVNLSVFDKMGNTDEDSIVVNVIKESISESDTLSQQGSIGLADVKANINPSPTSGNAPLTVNFTGGLSGAEGITLYGCAWNFGDGTTGGGPNISHTYQNPGTYNVTLTVRYGSIGTLPGQTQTVQNTATITVTQGSGGGGTPTTPSPSPVTPGLGQGCTPGVPGGGGSGGGGTKPDDSICKDGSECQGGYCYDNNNDGTKTCQSSPQGGKKADGKRCKSANDCIGGYCYDHNNDGDKTCQSSPQEGKKADGKRCKSANDCIGGYCYDHNNDGDKTCQSSPQGGGGAKVICTELHRQGLIPDDIYKADERYGSSLNPDLIKGYHMWAKPVVRIMRKSEFVTKIVYTLAKPWISQMAYEMGILSKGSFIGKVEMEIGNPICAIMGRTKIHIPKYLAKIKYIFREIKWQISRKSFIAFL